MTRSVEVDLGTEVQQTGEVGVCHLRLELAGDGAIVAAWHVDVDREEPIPVSLARRLVGACPEGVRVRHALLDLSDAQEAA